MRVAVIPARGGSKRVPRKNIREFCGRPMIAWSIKAAQQAGCMDRIIVSTDDAEIAQIAREHGAEVPFLRPRELADDHTGTAPVIAHAICELEAHGVQIAAVCCIYATAPFLQAEDLLRGLEQLESSGASYALSVTSYDFPIQRAVRITPQGRMAMFEPQHRLTRSQDLDPAYHDAAQFYWGRRDAWMDGCPVFSESSVAVVLPRHRVQDIDTQEDWHRAELMFQVLQRHSSLD